MKFKLIAAVLVVIVVLIAFVIGSAIRNSGQPATEGGEQPTSEVQQ
jgi:uncharacterized protein (UPF0333 family)